MVLISIKMELEFLTCINFQYMEQQTNSKFRNGLKDGGVSEDK